MHGKIVIFATTLEFSMGGIARSVPQMALALAESGLQVCLVAPRAKVPAFKIRSCEFLRVRFAESARELKQLLREEIDTLKGDAGLLYHAGVWSRWNHFACKVSRQADVSYVISPRSMLDPWALRYRGLKKKLAWRLYARRDYQLAAAIHVTAEMEARHVKAMGVVAPIFVVPHGVEKPMENIQVSRSPDSKRMLFLSRLHPKKGLVDLIEAFAMVAPDDWELVIAGNDDGGFGERLHCLTRKLNLVGRVSFLGGVEDDNKWMVYASADCFVLPSYSENFGLVIGEALICGIAVVTTTATPWERIREHRCGWICEPGMDNLSNTLKDVFSVSRAQLREMGQSGRKWIMDEFSWDSRAKELSFALANVLEDSRGPIGKD